VKRNWGDEINFTAERSAAFGEHPPEQIGQAFPGEKLRAQHCVAKFPVVRAKSNGFFKAERDPATLYAPVRGVGMWADSLRAPRTRLVRVGCDRGVAVAAHSMPEYDCVAFGRIANKAGVGVDPLHDVAGELRRDPPHDRLPSGEKT
jgi:hypothetical protein